MFKKFFTFFVMAAMAAAMLTGCDKDPKPEDEQTGPVQLVSKITYEDGDYITFEYDDKNFLTKYVSYAKDNVLESTMTISYDSKGEVVSMKADFPQYPKQNATALYTRMGNQIDMCVDANGDGKCDEPAAFHLEVNAQNELVKIVDEDEDRTRTDTYTYANGNVTKASWVFVWKTDNSTSGGSYVYTYDDKKSPFYDCATPSWFQEYQLGVSKNNLRTQTSTDSNGDTSEYKHTYTYDDAGYALTCETIDNAGDKETETYTYIKK